MLPAVAWVAILVLAYALGVTAIALILRGSAAGCRMGDEIHERDQMVAEYERSKHEQK